MTNNEEELRLNKVRIIIDELGLTNLTDTQDLFIQSYLRGDNGLCVTVIDELIIKVHEKRKDDYNKSTTKQ
jgi:hypothetical protein